MNARLHLILILTGLLTPGWSGTYEDAMNLYDAKAYGEAAAMLEQAASEGSKEAMFRLGTLYEYGLGVQQDQGKALEWYKRSSLYAASPDADASENASVNDEAPQWGDKADREMYRFILGKIDNTDTHARTFIERYLSSDFGLYTYKASYFLPYSYATSKYPLWSPDGIVGGNGTYDKNYEAEFQISLKKPLSFDLFGLNEAIVFAYTQKVWWQIYANSAPFRETNYEPELFITFPSADEFDRESGLKGVRLGFVHESNGRSGLQSRSWNRIYLDSIWQHGNLFTDLRLWYRIPEDENDDDNPDIEDYLGNGELTFTYLYGDHQFGLMFRNNLHFNGENRGAAALEWSYPMPYTEYSFWYVKLFSGYGESMIDYDRSVNKFAVGLSFSRGLF